MFSRIKIGRKGMANILAVLLLILLGIAAVILLGFYIYKTLNNPVLAPAFNCLELQLERKISLQGACYDSEKGDVVLNVRRLGDGLQVDRIYFVLGLEDGRRKRYCCGGECESCDILEDGSSEDYYLEGEGLEREVALEVFGCEIDEKEIKSCGVWDIIRL